jgi:hypothetical protein
MSELKWDGAEWRALRDAKLREWMLGDENAVQTVIMLSTITEVWDDLIDGDPVSPDEVHGAFISAMVGLNCNPFYKAWEPLITGTVLAGINAWLDSIELERGETVAERMQAFYIRNYIFEMVNVCAFAIGGWKHMRKVSGEIRAFATHETYAQWEHAL